MQKKGPKACRIDGLDGLNGGHDEAAERTKMVNRLRRIEGQVRGVSDMVSSGRPCEDVAQQMSAIRKALERAYMHMMACSLMEVAENHAAADRPMRDDVQRVLSLLQKYN